MKKNMDHQTKEMICPLCEKKHRIMVGKRWTEALVKGETVEYKEQYYRCENAPDDENEFVSGELLNLNLLHARDAYREMEGLLTSEEIKQIRKKYDLTQKDLANLLGWGEITVTRYESKLVQDETYDSILRLTWENPLFALQSLEKHKGRFTSDRYEMIREQILRKLESSGMSYLKLQNLEARYSRFSETSDANGFQTLDLSKLSEIVGYYAQSIGNLHKVKLMKLLWYTDVLHYKRHGKALTGLVYQHKPFGALPLGYDELIYLPTVRVQEEVINWELCYQILPAKARQRFHFSKEEEAVLQVVLEKFKNFNTREIVEYMHEETAYPSTADSQIIPFSMAQI